MCKIYNLPKNCSKTPLINQKRLSLFTARGASGSADSPDLYACGSCSYRT